MSIFDDLRKKRAAAMLLLLEWQIEEQQLDVQVLVQDF